jgi:heme-degrading monooxygenase HmoA
MTDAIEITTFRLAGCSFDDFIKANAEVDAWLKRQPGFQSRHILEQDDGTVAEVLFWDTVDNVTDAASGLMAELGHSAVHAMIDQSTVSWNVSPVRHAVTNERHDKA